MSLSYAYSPHIWLSIIAIIVLFGLAVFSFRHRDVPGALPFFIGVTFSILWSVGLVFEYLAVGIDLKIFWRKFQVVFQLPTATAITCFLLEYTWPKRWLTRRNLVLLSIVPLLVILVIVTNPVHHLFWEGFDFDGALVVIRGPLMKYFIAYVYVNFFMNLAVLIWLFIHSPQNRWLVVIIIIGQIFMRVMYFLDLSDQMLLTIRFTAVGIALTSLMYVIVFFRFRIIGPIPLARQTVINQIPIGMLVLDHQLKITSLNPTAEQMLGVSSQHVKNKPVREIIDAYPQELLGVNGDHHLEFNHRSGGKDRDYFLDIHHLKNWRDAHVGQLLLLTDVTEQREAQARILEQGRVMATLQEREQLARELHDDLAQVFAFIDTQGQTIQRLLERGDFEIANRHLVRLIEVAREGEVDIRESIRAMRLTLSEHGLLYTLENYLSQFERDTSIHTDLITSDDFNINLIDPMVAVQLLRILQESLTNIRRHAMASEVQIKFDQVDGSIYVAVQDNGRGFEVTQNDLSEANHYGLMMMRERAQSIGGRIDLSSQPGQGTEIIFCVPIDKKRVTL